jgi:hypothetical protein
MKPLLTVALCLTVTVTTKAGDSFRPPAVPLVACDPYFSVWSQSDELTGTETTHWTGKPHRLTALLQVDDKTYRLMGETPEEAPALPQKSVEVLPTRTIYTFAGANVDVTLTFTTPTLPSDLMVLSRPTTYLTCAVKATDGGAHQTLFYFDASGELATNTPDQKVNGSMEELSSSEALKIGTVSQSVLGKAGDDLRIDWGYLYLTAPGRFKPTFGFGEPGALQRHFSDATQPGAPAFPVEAGQVAAALTMDFGKVGAEAVSRYVVLAYDDLYAIDYMKEKLRPYWRKDGWEAADLLAAAMNEYDALMKECAAFDQSLMADLEKLGGKEYAQIGALAYRQCFAAGKFVADANGQPLQFCKENHSNGCIATSDVFYPMAPQFLLMGPTLTKSFMVPFMDYAASERWRFPFAPHDLGTYPKANGQVYGGGERTEENQMPVEESGNLLILFGALAKMEGNADFAGLYWKQLGQWAKYLEETGFDPENQLCTDDFAGHMAHNVNLSAKAICGLGSYAMLCQMRGEGAEAERYAGIAKKYATQWVEAARDGDHFRLAFDKPGSWSQKYNLVWDRILGLGLFPDEVLATEMAFYRKTQNPFGLALDNRSDYTKLDWVLWTATLTEKQEDFEALVKPVHKFLHETPDRSPMTDWYFTSTAKKRGFTARPVVGGVFLRALYEDAVWKKYAALDQTKAADWAPMPVPPKTRPLVATSEPPVIRWRYSTERPEGEWFADGYDAEEWKEGRGGFGTANTPGAVIGTVWKSNDIWLRRRFELPEELPARVGLRIHHDEDAAIYLNGKKVAELGGFTGEYEVIEIAVDALRPGTNTLAIHCHQTEGGQYIDCGLDVILPSTPAR